MQSGAYGLQFLGIVHFYKTFVVQWYMAEEDGNQSTRRQPCITDPQGVSPGSALLILSLCLPEET